MTIRKNTIDDAAKYMCPFFVCQMTALLCLFCEDPGAVHVPGKSMFLSLVSTTNGGSPEFLVPHLTPGAIVIIYSSEAPAEDLTSGLVLAKQGYKRQVTDTS
jgi:hypothetical protein